MLSGDEFIERHDMREERKDVGTEKLMFDRCAGGSAVRNHGDFIAEIESLQRTCMDAYRGDTACDDDAGHSFVAESRMQAGIGECVEALLAGKLDDSITVGLDLWNRFGTGSPLLECLHVTNRLENADGIFKLIVEIAEHDGRADHRHVTALEGFNQSDRVFKGATDTV